MRESPSLRELDELDKLIDQNIRALLNKKAADFPNAAPQYGTLVADLAKIPITYNDNRRTRQERLVRAVEAIQACQRHGARNYLLHKPAAMSDLMIIGSGASDKVFADEYPDLNAGQLTLLSHFNRAWNTTVKPLLAERIEKYGREKLAAEGLTQAVREWFAVHHDAIQNLLQPSDSALASMDFKSLLEMLQQMNTNPACVEHFGALLRHEPTGVGIGEHLSAIAEHFTVSAEKINDRGVNGIKQLMRELILGRLPAGSERAVHDLRDRYWELVEMPFYETSNVLKIPYRK